MNKVALVTGASSGIGKATARNLVKDGYTVYGAARRAEKLAVLKKDGINTIILDITSDESIKNCVREIIEREGRIDILVNNAGFGNFGSLEESPMELARAQYDVNVFGLIRISNEVLPHMRKQSYGKILNISSIGGKIVIPFGGWYHSTKFAVEALSDAMRMEVKQFGIDVIVIEPGGIASEWDSIALGSLHRISGSGPYARVAQKCMAGLKKGYERAKSPAVIADTISKAIAAGRPKIRYAAGDRAATVLFLRKILSDRFFYWIIKRNLM